MIITAKDNKKIKEIRKLEQKKYRDKTKMFIIEGEHLVKEAYKYGCLKELILEENTSTDISLDIDTIYVTKEVLKSISSLDEPYNIMGICSYPTENKELGNKILILDGVQDPGNLGTIIRSSVAFNVSDIVLSNTTVDLYNSKVLRSTQGMNFGINIIRKNLNDFVPFLKEEGYKIFATDVVNGIDIKNVCNLTKYAIIMGNEGNGVSQNIKDMCDENIYINMNEKCESLNVAVATSIILYELNK